MSNATKTNTKLQFTKLHVEQGLLNIKKIYDNEMNQPTNMHQVIITQVLKAK